MKVLSQVKAHGSCIESPGHILLLGSRHSDHTQHIVTVTAACAASVSVQAMTTEHLGTCDCGYSPVNLAQQPHCRMSQAA